MENKETIFELKNIEEKESKAGRKYFVCKNGKDTYSCFESAIVDELKKHLGKKIKVEIAESDKGFKNIRKFLGEVSEEKINEAKPAEIAEARKAKDQSIYTSYAKDIFIAIVSNFPKGSEGEAMQVSIDLIKQAKEAFKEA